MKKGACDKMNDVLLCGLQNPFVEHLADKTFDRIIYEA